MQQNLLSSSYFKNLNNTEVKQSQKSTLKENKEKVIKNEQNKAIKTTSEPDKKTTKGTKVQMSNKVQEQKQIIIENSYDDNLWRKVNVKLNNFLKQRVC